MEEKSQSPYVNGQWRRMLVRFYDIAWVTDMLRRSEFPGQRSHCVEQSAGCATFTGHVTGHI